MNYMYGKEIAEDIQSDELNALIEAARGYVMSPEEHRQQMISWVSGELGFEHPDWPMEKCRELAEQAVRNRYG
jgi:hypothetical protein